MVEVKKLAEGRKTCSQEINMRHNNNGYIGYDSSGGPRGIIRPGDFYLRSLPTPVSTEFNDTTGPPTSLLQAATLVFSNSLELRVGYSIVPTGPGEVSPSSP